MKIEHFKLLEAGPTLGGFAVKPLNIEDQGVDEGLGKDLAKMAAVPVIAGAAAVGGQWLDDQKPHVEIGGRQVMVIDNPGWGTIPSNAMTLTGKDGKEYKVWKPSGKGTSQWLATPAETVKESSDISGLLAASSLNREFLLTVNIDGATKKFRVKAQSPRVAQEIFKRRYATAQVVDVKEITGESQESTQSKFEKHLAQHGYDVDERAAYWTNKLKELEAQRQKYIDWGVLKPDDVAPIAEDSVEEALKLDAPSRVMPRDELQSYADRIKTGTKTKKDKFAPIIHASNIKAITKTDSPDTAWDLDDLAAQITTRPKAILGTNAKMTKSATEGEIIYDLTLPALSGIVVDEETGDFVEVTTCPGAGQCQLFCYARKGGYVMFPASSMSAAQALNFLLNDPKGYMTKVNQEIATIKKRTDKAGIQLVVRWHDAGDFFSKDYLNLAFDIARANPDVKFYAYTKIADVATGDKPANFIINFSSGAKRGEEKRIEIHKKQGNVVKQGVTVPKDMFFDLIARDGNKLIKDEKGRTQFKSPEAVEQFKQRLAQAYNVDPKSIITYDQMLAMPPSDTPKWNVIVQPGAGDRAANRKDVIDSYLMFH